MLLKRLAPLTLLACLMGCIPGTQPLPQTSDFAALDQNLSAIVAKHGVRTAGVGVIRNGKLVWTAYYGEQAPGIAANRDTLFNVASVTKTVAAETVLRLASSGKLSLDEPMSSAWIDPDLANDPQVTQLTPRMALNHTTGFLNWRFFSKDYKLKFVNPPGTKYGYSGEGFEYVSRFSERKLGQSFAQLARQQVLTPSGMLRTRIAVETSNPNIATPYDAKGVRQKPYCRPKNVCRKDGLALAADDMMITVEDHAAFLIGVMRHQGLNRRIAAQREKVQTPFTGETAVVDCAATGHPPCPAAQGYGLGWVVLDYANDKIIGHSGSDWSELAIGYFHTRSRDGIIVFLNGPNDFDRAAMPEMLEALDPGSPFAHQIRRWKAL